MKAVEQQQPNSMDSSDSVNGGSEYAYRPLTTKHRRAGSTGTTGDEEYTTDEDEFYGDETDCSGPSLHPHPILKSDLARAATDLFGYEKHNDEDAEPTSLFDEDEKFTPQSSIKTISLFSYNEKISRGVLGRQSSSSKEIGMEKSAPKFDSSTSLIENEIENAEIKEETLEFENEKKTRPLDRRLSLDTTTSIPEAAAGSSSDLRPGENHELSPRKLPADDEQLFIKSQMKRDCTSSRIRSGSPPSPSALQWGRAVAEVKEQAVAKLQEELKRAHEELKLKDEEVSRLSRIRQDVEAELEELTASLFQEAHNMVREANVRQATAERLLEESRMKAEVLAAEVAALKTLVLTSTPARPNPHLHPQIDTRGRNSGNTEDCQASLFTKKHRRSPSHFNLKYGRENSPPDSPQKEQRTSLPCERNGFDGHWEREKEKEGEREREREKLRDKESKDSGLEVDPRVHSEFLQWKTNPSVDKSDPFIERIFREDIDLCLDFPNLDLGLKVRQAVLDGIIFIEAVSDKTKLAFPKKCALLEAARQCHYRMRLGDQDNQWYCISQICRNRIIAVCDFLNYLRYIERGLVKSSVHDIYWEINRLRKEMVFSRLGLALSSS
ncbi:guanine nucleotide exchange factor for Rab-3A-like [Leptopilina heterotoma]|uniref:guanine nucleotide exchange factor for Rab-3A-like n=1 Tax=Leptopilina heterotoma TaxID=63436 RepID=UPI001CA81541|nr:guanine nucleotide exchange factor for Rab-3A-like [Leptopilina heterotoma]XP_043473342.1 guanine nucleotide exchange factor for Rab-3A-like [Leptopilina heterotoma]